MYTNGSASKEYLRNAVLTASPVKLHLMLLDGAIRFAQRGREGLERNDHEATYNGLERAQRIVLALNEGLRPEVDPRLVEQVRSLYHFVYTRLVDGCLRRERPAIDDALRILRHQRDTWQMVLDKLAAEAGAATASAGPAATHSRGQPEPLNVAG